MAKLPTPHFSLIPDFEHIEMSQEQDHPMDDDERGRMSTPDRSDRSRMRSASPRTLQQRSHRGSRRRAPTIRWKWNPIHECIVHSGSECKVCKDYLAHLNDGAMEDDGSYVDACDKRSASFVPIAQWRQDTSELRRLRDDLEDSRRRERDLELEVDDLRVEVNSLETSLKASNSIPSYAAVAKTQRPTQTHAKRAPALTKPTFVLNVVDSPQTVAPPVAPSATAAAKGKATALPTMDYDNALSYDDDEYDTDYDPAEAEAAEAKAADSACARLVVAILNGTVPTHAVGPAGSNSVEGRVPDIRPASDAEFRLALRALEQAHAENNAYKNNLLSSIRQYVSACHKAEHKSNVQRSAISQWRVPDWAEKIKYDPNTGTVKLAGYTKEEERNRRIKDEKDMPSKQSLLLLSVSNQLGLTTNGKPDPRLGNISSPRHEDHPLVWMEWAAKITRSQPKGITLGYNGYPYERVIRGFRRFAPFFKEKKEKKEKKGTNPPPEEMERRSHQRRGQILTMGIVAQIQLYGELLAKGGLTVHPTPSWEPIAFSPDVDEMECARYLAMRGVTTDEVLDASQYAFTWLEHSDNTEKDTMTRVLINTYRERGRTRPERQPWPDSMSYIYHQGLARWIPVLPTAGATSRVAHTLSVPTIMGSTATPSLAGLSTPSLQPQPPAVPPMTPVIDEVPLGAPPDENVEMNEPHDSEDPSRVMDTDNS